MSLQQDLIGKILKCRCCQTNYELKGVVVLPKALTPRENELGVISSLSLTFGPSGR